MVGPRNIARSAGSRAMPCSGRGHGFDHLRMPAHAEIVVRAPNDDFFNSLRPVQEGARKSLCVPCKVSEKPVTALLLQLCYGFNEETRVRHRERPPNFCPGKERQARARTTALILKA